MEHQKKRWPQPVPGRRSDPVAPPLASAPEPDLEDEVDLRRAWGTVLRFRTIILAVAGVVFVVPVLATFLMRPVYRASALVEIEPMARSLVQLDTLDQRGDGRDQEYLETQWRILESESIAESVIDRLGLHEHPELTGDERQTGFLAGLEGIAHALGLGAADSDASDLAMGWARSRNFLDRVSIEPVRDSNLVAVHFDSFDPELAASVANAIVDEYARMKELRRVRSTSKAKTFLEAEIAVAQERLQQSERRLNEFAREHAIFDVDERTSLGRSPD